MGPGGLSPNHLSGHVTPLSGRLHAHGGHSPLHLNGPGTMTMGPPQLLHPNSAAAAGMAHHHHGMHHSHQQHHPGPPHGQPNNHHMPPMHALHPHLSSDGRHPMDHHPGYAITANISLKYANKTFINALALLR